MKKMIYLGLVLSLLLSGCALNRDSEESEVEKTEEEDAKAIIPKYNISDNYYRTILPFEPSAARGQVVSNLNTRYDMTEMEIGLMRIAQENFSTNDYLFKEGQFLSKETIGSWLQRKYTEEQLAEKAKNSNPKKDIEDIPNLGLNPIDDGKGDIEDRNKKSPLYLAHILEHDYMVKKSDDTVTLGGVVIGLALNSVHYYQKVAYGDTFETKIPEQEMISEGKKIAEIVLERLRKQDELANVPITIALFKQEKSSSVVPGNFVAYTHVGKGKNSISNWKDLNEKYYLFPSETAKEEHRDDNTFFLNFKQDVEEYFPNFNGVIGRGFYIDDQLTELKIEIPIQFYGKTEAIGFTQYVTGLVMEHFQNYISVEVSVSSVYGQEALIVRNAGDDEPTVHIYQ